MRFPVPVVGTAVILSALSFWHFNTGLPAGPEQRAAASAKEPVEVAEPQARLVRAEEAEIPDEAEQRERARQAMLHFENRFAEEHRDSNSSLSVGEEVTRELEAHGVAGTRLETSECGAKSCRLEFVFDDEDTLRQTVRRLPFLLPTQGGMAWFIDPVHPLRVVLFADREESQTTVAPRQRR